jgi:uncharacterized protein (DUF1800 family)
MELFTLGVDHFTEQDVREVARAFTGWGLERGQFVFRAANHDGGVKTILGKTGPFDGKAVVKLLVEHPQTARYLSRRLFEFFAYPEPSAKDLEPLVAAYVRTGGSVKAMLRALFTSPAFYSPKAYRAKVKSPVEFTVGAIRALGAATDGFPLPGVTTRMGQALFNPPNVAGWPGGVHWLTSTTWLERVNFCNALVTARTDSRYIPPPLESIVERHRLTTPEAIVDYFGDLLLDGQVSRPMRETLLGYLTGGPLANAPALPAVPAGAPISPGARSAAKQLLAPPIRPAFIDQKVRGLVYLMLVSPEYQLA